MLKSSKSSDVRSIDQLIVDICRSEGTCTAPRSQSFCWTYKAQINGKNQTMLEFFSQFPVISIISYDHGAIRWYPSEYLYEEKPNMWCLAIDPYGSTSQMIIGGSSMRQNNFIFDMEKE